MCMLGKLEVNMIEFLANPLCSAIEIFHCVFLSKGFVIQELLIISHFHAQDGWTALHQAAMEGHHQTCQILIKHGASVNAQDNVRDNLNFQKALSKL